MPKPRKGETQDKFIKRCIPQIINEGKPSKQAVAICHSLWVNKKEAEKLKIDWTVKQT